MSAGCERRFRHLILRRPDGLMVRRRAQRAVSNHGSRLGLAAILRDAPSRLRPTGMLFRMRTDDASRNARGITYPTPAARSCSPRSRPPPLILGLLFLAEDRVV